MEFAGFFHKRGTFAIHTYNRKKRIVNGYFIQFSLVDMWLYPHKEERYNNGSWLCGWLFFYFGNIRVRAIKTNEGE